ncbi:sigma-70 family RNA polymerase sigma factor [Bacillus sp. UMB0893]|uniref:sigma-70 family RNA polymerase sigma factor n=1 Tax=Bacillus sp. UMB0893 TaxID=2066053 RepID=UPI000C76BB03|nr:sigma-70 family RNA polymerase sigma factor [Bacillus sp. UMB0893]PLR66184.1 RNA polymerase subunit sigma-70 [Bacillus sp. UMB0893]
MEDDKIVNYIIYKKDEGLELLIDMYAGLITSIVRKHLGSLREYEEECVNDVLLAIWTNIGHFDKNKNTLKNWIAAISKYKAIDYKRKYLKSKKNIIFTELGSPLHTNNLNLQNEIKAEVDELLSHLNEGDRDLFEKYYLEDVLLESIAIKRNTTINNLYNRLSRGRRKLKGLLK